MRGAARRRDRRTRRALAPDEPGDPAKAKPGLLSKSASISRSNSRCRSICCSTTRPARDVRLGDFFGKRPVVLALVYYECPMLCTQVLNGLVSALGVLTFDVGKDSTSSPSASTRRRRRARRAEEAGLRRALRAAADGRRLALPDRHARRTSSGSPPRSASATPTTQTIQQYAHGAAIEVLTPKGVRRELLLRHRVLAARPPVRRWSKRPTSGSARSIDDALLLCYHYDPATGKYGAAVHRRHSHRRASRRCWRLLTFLFVSLRRERAAAPRRDRVTGYRT